jgi:hypothetical protein
MLTGDTFERVGPALPTPRSRRWRALVALCRSEPGVWFVADTFPFSRANSAYNLTSHLKVRHGLEARTHKVDEGIRVYARAANGDGE